MYWPYTRIKEFDDRNFVTVSGITALRLWASVHFLDFRGILYFLQGERILLPYQKPSKDYPLTEKLSKLRHNVALAAINHAVS